MKTLKSKFLSALSIGIHDGLTEEKKLALRIAAMDAYWSLVAMSFYAVYSFHHSLYPAAWIHLVVFSVTIFGTYLLSWSL